MHSNLFQISVMSITSFFFSKKATFAVIPVENGDIGIFSGHISIFASIKPGIVKIIEYPKNEKNLFVYRGTLEIKKNIVTIVSDVVMRLEDFNENRAISEKKEIELQRVQGKKEIALIEADLSILNSQLAAIRKLKRKKKM